MIAIDVGAVVAANGGGGGGGTFSETTGPLPGGDANAATMPVAGGAGIGNTGGAGSGGNSTAGGDGGAGLGEVGGAGGGGGAGFILAFPTLTTNAGTVSPTPVTN